MSNGQVLSASAESVIQQGLPIPVYKCEQGTIYASQAIPFTDGDLVRFWNCLSLGYSSIMVTDYGETLTIVRLP